MRKPIPVTLIVIGMLAIWYTFSWVESRKTAEEELNRADAVRGQLATATGGELGSTPKQADTNCIGEDSPAAATATARIRFNLALNKQFEAQGYDIKSQIVDCTWDALYLTGEDATGEKLRPLLLQNGGRETLRKLGFKKLTWGPSIWNQKARIILD